MLLFKYLWLVILIGVYLVWTVSVFLMRKESSSWSLWWLNEGIYWLFITLGITFTLSLGYFIVTFVN